MSSETEQLTSEVICIAFCPDTVKKLRQIGDDKFARLAVFILFVRNIVFFCLFFLSFRSFRGPFFPEPHFSITKQVVFTI